MKEGEGERLHHGCWEMDAPVIMMHQEFYLIHLKALQFVCD